jgi:hypothetical protein
VDTLGFSAGFMPSVGRLQLGWGWEFVCVCMDGFSCKSMCIIMWLT